MNNQQVVRLRASTPLSERLNSIELQNRPRASVQVNPTYQSGAVLIISLVMLLLLTLIGTTGMQTTSLEEKMVGNMRNQNDAFQIAETVLRAGEAIIQAAVTPASLATLCSLCANGYYDSSTDTTACPQLPNWQTIDWTDPTQVATYNVNGTNYAFYIERLDVEFPSVIIAGTPINGVPINWYRITARGTGSMNNAVVLLQSTYTR
ncbi:MAG: PilX N-terminal domain-containing pilus assembly protein [Methylococcaceae bacterium]